MSNTELKTAIVKVLLKRDVVDVLHLSVFAHEVPVLAAANPNSELTVTKAVSRVERNIENEYMRMCRAYGESNVATIYGDPRSTGFDLSAKVEEVIGHALETSSEFDEPETKFDEPATDGGPSLPEFTQAQLEEISESEGMVGLRQIGGMLDVTSTSAKGLIEKILVAQGNEYVEEMSDAEAGEE